MFAEYNLQQTKRFLKRTAIPSLHLPVNPVKKLREQANKARFERLLMRNEMNKNINTEKVYISQHDGTDQADRAMKQLTFKKSILRKVQSTKCEPNMTCSKIEEDHNYYVKPDTEKHQTHPRVKLIESDVRQHVTPEPFMQIFVKTESPQESPQFVLQPIKTEPPEPVVENVNAQASINCSIPSMENRIMSSSELTALTGIESLEILNSIIETVERITTDGCEPYNRMLNARDRVIMTYTKLKHNLSYSLLAIFFNCSTAENCQKIFQETIKVLNQCSLL